MQAIVLGTIFVMIKTFQSLSDYLKDSKRGNNCWILALQTIFRNSHWSCTSSLRGYTGSKTETYIPILQLNY